MSSDDDAVRHAASKRYASGDAIWSPLDKWNAFKRAGIERFCRSALGGLPPTLSVLNAGSGSTLYSWMPEHAVNLDRFSSQVSKLPNPIVGDLEALPFKTGSFDVIVCVGPVLNYASALEAISEMAGVLKPAGRLILHYETSDSAEHLLTPLWKRDVAPLHTLNNGSSDLVWIYSRRFIRRTLSRNGIRIERRHGFHIASAALLRLGFDQHTAAGAAAYDRLLRPFAFLADDVILVGRKV